MWEEETLADSDPTTTTNIASGERNLPPTLAVGSVSNLLTPPPNPRCEEYVHYL